MISGTPISTVRPIRTSVLSSSTETSTIDTTAPAKRALTSIVPPMLEVSAVPMATTSPVAMRLGSVAPSSVAWRAVSCTVR